MSTRGGSSGSTAPARTSSGSSSSGAGIVTPRAPRSSAAGPSRRPPLPASVLGRAPEVDPAAAWAGRRRARWRPVPEPAPRAGPGRAGTRPRGRPRRGSPGIGERQVAHRRHPGAPVGAQRGGQVRIELRVQLRVAAPVGELVGVDHLRPVLRRDRDPVGLRAHHRRGRAELNPAGEQLRCQRVGAEGEEAADVGAVDADPRGPGRERLGDHGAQPVEAEAGRRVAAPDDLRAGRGAGPAGALEADDRPCSRGDGREVGGAVVPGRRRGCGRRSRAAPRRRAPRSSPAACTRRSPPSSRRSRRRPPRSSRLAVRRRPGLGEEVELADAEVLVDVGAVAVQVRLAVAVEGQRTGSRGLVVGRLVGRCRSSG